MMYLNASLMLKSHVVINHKILKIKNEKNFNLLCRHSGLCLKWAANRMLGKLGVGEEVTWVLHDIYCMKFPKPSTMYWKDQWLFFISFLGATLWICKTMMYKPQKSMNDCTRKLGVRQSCYGKTLCFHGIFTEVDL